MERVLEALYEGGVFKPLEPLSLPEHQRVTVTIHLPCTESPDIELEAWQQVYAGLSDQDIVEIESIALDRGQFMRQEA